MRFLLRDGCVVTDTRSLDFDRPASAAEREWWALIQRLRARNLWADDGDLRTDDGQTNCLADSEAEG
jgi:hypothetical protein